MGFLKRFARVLLRVLGFLLIALFILIAGPYFAFGSYRPLEPLTARLILIGLVLVAWVFWALLKRLKANRASDQIAAAVMQPAAAAEPADVVKLRERFEEAVATLKQQRKGGANLYELPWYVIIGAPGSGKTTALVNSGLKFPLEARMGRGALKGVGGTRNCDWWFTDEAVFLDTAGRFTTQDSDASADAAGWTEFLALLKKYRKRRPVNGVILTISAVDLMAQSDAAREAQTDAARRRLIELNRELKIQLPVYLMVTKTDLVAGFSEYFDDLTAEGRAQVWGVTFPLEQSVSGGGPQAFGGEFDALVERLNQRVFGRVEEDRDVRRRTRNFGFPQQMGALRDALTGFVADVFSSTQFDQPILLRGVYFTSGTQEGTPIDRLLGAMGRGFGLTPELVPPTGRGKAYFVERLLREVMIGESGLAGLNTRLEMQKAALQLGAYAAAAVLAALLVVAVLVSYNRNRTYLDQVAADVAEQQKVPAVRADAPPDRILARLNALSAIVASADRHRDEPWGMKWGLFQGRSIGNAARDAYVREVDGLVLPMVASRFRDRLVAYRSAPEKLTEYLKAYLMLGEPARVDREFLTRLVEAEFGVAGGADPTRPTIATHFKALLEYAPTLRPVPTDPKIIAQSRAIINQVPIARQVYESLQLKYAGDTARAVPLDSAGGREGLLRRRSGKSLSEPVPAIYSKAVFTEITGLDAVGLVKQFVTDDWVRGDTGTSGGNAIKLTSEVFDLYERDYIANWDATLADLQIAPIGIGRDGARALEVLGGPSSPLRTLIATVTANTTLVSLGDKVTAQAAANAATSLRQRAESLIPGLGDAAGVPQKVSTPGAIVAARYQPVHRLLEGEPGKTAVDRLVAAINNIQLQLTVLGGRNPKSSPEFQESMTLFRQEVAALPPVIRAMFGSLEDDVVTAVTTENVKIATEGLNDAFLREVIPTCRAMTSGRYPFRPGSTIDVTLSDFGRLFGFGGIFESFFNARLAQLVDRSKRPWTWREDVNMPEQMLRTFETAEEIRSLFFAPGSQSPGARFTVLLAGYDASVSRFTLDIEGQSISSTNQQRAYQIGWPGPTALQINLRIEQRFGDARTARWDGPWAWFRFFDASAPRRESANRFVLTAKAGDLQGQLLVEAFSVNNPLASDQWRQFTCEP